MTEAWEALVPRMRELRDLASAAKLLHWDQSVLMPPGGAEARAHAMATIESIAHDKLTDPEIGRLLDELSGNGSLDEVRASSVRVLKRDYDKATRVPPDLVRALAEIRGLAYQTWTEARPRSDFSMLEPHLSRFVELKKEEADALGWEDERYDALLDDFEPGLKSSQVSELFDELVAGLKPIVESVLQHVGDPPGFLSGDYREARQKDFCEWLVAQIGFQGERGRLDKSPHPFTIGIHKGDIRQTIRTDPSNLTDSLYAAMHETGHALYEQGIPDELRDLPVGSAPSLGMHESQSRLWENHVGRSRPFAHFLLPKLKERFPEELGMVDLDEFYLGVNHPRRTLIRVTADELTYNLHIALRFEIELSMFRGDLDVADLPEAWNDAMERHVGLRPGNDSDGVLQDMHWSIGGYGYFPTYTIGTLYAAAFFARAEQDLGSLAGDLRAGESRRLLDWLRENIHARAYIDEAGDLATKVLGAPPGAGPYLDYLRVKYGELYDVSL
ncbi:MAG: carboxypeptidase M32 [Actinomycetota bacterium]